MRTVKLRPWGAAQTVEARLENSPASDPPTLVAHIGGRTVEFHWHSNDSASGHLDIHGERAVVYATVHDSEVAVWLRGHIYRFQIERPTARRAAEQSVSTAANITAPMPGTVLKIECRTGDVLKPHQPVIVLESMKMEMTLSAPAAARVKSICCTQDQLVSLGAVLVELEPENDE